MLVVGAFFLLVLVWPLVAAALFFRGVDEGRGLDVPAARARLAQPLQALDVRTESLDGQATAVVVFARFGLPEIYELRLQWLPPALDAAAMAGRRLGEHQDALGDGWWRVVR